MYYKWKDKLTNRYTIKDEEYSYIVKFLMEQRFDNNIPLSCKIECLDCYYEPITRFYESILQITRPDESYIINLPVKLPKYWIWQNDDFNCDMANILDDFKSESTEQFYDYCFKGEQNE